MENDTIEPGTGTDVVEETTTTEAAAETTTEEKACDDSHCGGEGKAEAQEETEEGEDDNG